MKTTHKVNLIWALKPVGCTVIDSFTERGVEYKKVRITQDMGRSAGRYAKGQSLTVEAHKVTQIKCSASK